MTRSNYTVMETMNNAIVENNLTFGSPSSAKSIGLDSNGDLAISSQGNNISFKDNTISLSANPGANFRYHLIKTRKC